ncbi:MAG: insulinase family protein [Planctomycetota bacterium]|nr:MAG: insulinase family protein [Planctomycetota bacterium]
MKTLQRVASARLDEEVLLARAGGMRVGVVRKPGYSTAAANLGLRFGSTATRFRGVDGREHAVPEGSAHFLEHKLFEGREEKVFDRFGRLGARFNGGTGFYTTNYYFSTAGRFDQCLEVLLDFVQHPLITEERVEKEKGIIEQEVRMYQDEPDYHGYFLLHRALYHRLPIRIEPAGDVASVRATRAADLQACYDNFYRPENLVLVVAGDFDPEQVLARVESLLDSPQPGSGRILRPEEPPLPAARRLEESFAVTRHNLWLAWRERGGVGLGRPLMRRRILSSLVLDLALDHSSEYHDDLYRRGVVDDTFNVGYSADEDYGYALINGQTEDPERFLAEIQAAVARFLDAGVRPEDFERVRRAYYGWIVTRLQTPSALASSVLNALLEDMEPFSMLAEVEEATVEAVEQRARELLDPARAAVALLRPKA